MPTVRIGEGRAGFGNRQGFVDRLVVDVFVPAAFERTIVQRVGDDLVSDAEAEAGGALGTGGEAGVNPAEFVQLRIERLRGCRAAETAVVAVREEAVCSERDGIGTCRIDIVGAARCIDEEGCRRTVVVVRPDVPHCG